MIGLFEFYFWYSFRKRDGVFNEYFLLNFFDDFHYFHSEKSYTTIIILISALSLLAVSVLYIFYRKTHKKKEEATINLQQEKENVEVLSKKVNESFEEIIHLAKTNSPEFWGRFQEIYPEFRNKLLEINPDLKTTELTLCAYILLGFNTKDVAEYTFKAEKTIRNNKYNVRKRLDVPAKTDFTIWLRNQADS